MNRVVAIHQPNFFPWLGYFDKIARADAFIFFDNVQFPKSGSGVWSNRVKLLVGGEPRWVTAAIDRTHSGAKRICEMKFSPSNPWREKILKTLALNYRKHTFYNESMEILEPLISDPEPNLSHYNITAVKKISEKIGIDRNKFLCSSAIDAAGSSNELLCNLTIYAGGSTYLCGGGADGYQDENVFQKHNVILKKQDFRHPRYDQLNSREFVSGLSVIDAAMNVGWDGVRQMLKVVDK